MVHCIWCQVSESSYPKVIGMLLINHFHEILLLYSSPDHSIDGSATVTAIELNIDSCCNDESEHQVQGPEELNSSSDDLPETVPVVGPITFEEHKKILQSKIQKDFKELEQCKSSGLKYQAMYEGARVMVDVENIVKLFEGPSEKENY